jgi:hypothetical protein
MIGRPAQAIPAQAGRPMEHLHLARHAAATQNRAIGTLNKGQATPLPAIRFGGLERLPGEPM